MYCMSWYVAEGDFGEKMETYSLSTQVARCGVRCYVNRNTLQFSKREHPFGNVPCTRAWRHVPGNTKRPMYHPSRTEFSAKPNAEYKVQMSISASVCG